MSLARRVWDAIRGADSLAFDPSAEASRMSLPELIALTNSPYSLLNYGNSTRGGRPAEDIENSFTGYIYGAYKANGPVFATILARGLLFSEARFQWQRIENGRPGELFGTPALAKLENPWPNGTTGELLWRAEQDVSLSGNFYLADEGDRVRRLRPDWVSIILTGDPDHEHNVDVAGYMYSPGGIEAGGAAEFYLPADVAHWSPIPDPAALYRGMSWLQPIVEEIRADGQATRHKRMFFENGATLSTVVSMKETVTPAQFAEFMAITNAAHQGADNAYKTLYLGGGADAKVVSADLRQLDFKNTQGAGETRITAAGGVPAVIVGLSEGLQAATYSNYGQARRKFGDHWARPQWRSFAAAMQPILDKPSGVNRLWYDDRDIAFLREDAADQAAIVKEQALTIEALIRAGYKPDAVASAVTAGDLASLAGNHTGLVSVQLLPPGTVAKPPAAPAADSKATPAADDPPADPAPGGTQ